MVERISEERCVIRSERVVLGDGLDEPFRVVAAEITTHGAWIEDVRELDGSERDARLRDPEPPEVAKRIELGELLVCPAFVNAHTHVALNAFRGLTQTSDLRGNMVEGLFYRLEGSLSAEDVRAFARMGAYECLRHGVGLVWDHYYGGTELAAAFADVGLPAVVAPTLQDRGGPGVSQCRQQLDDTLSLTDASWANRHVYAALGPHATDTVSPELWQRVARLAREHELVIHAHMAQSREEYERVQERDGCSPVELLARTGVLEAPRALLVHAIYASDDDLDLLDSERHILGYCPLSQSQFAFPASVNSWLAHNVPWIVATDCAPSNDSMNVQRELAVTAASRGMLTTGSEAMRAFQRQGSLESVQRVDAFRQDDFDAACVLGDPSFLLSRVWSLAGRLHPRVKAGVISVGALANLLVLDPSSPVFWPGGDVLRVLAYADIGAAIQATMIAGRFRRRDSTEDDELYRQHRDEADRRLRDHLGRLGLA